MLDFFASYPYVVYSIIAWGYVFAFIRIKGIQRLWPVAIFGGFSSFGATLWLLSVGLYKFNTNFLLVLGIPFFYIVCSVAISIIFAYYFGYKIIPRIIQILLFAGLITFTDSVVESVNKTKYLVQFNTLNEYVFDVMILTAFAFLMTNLFGKRMYKVEKI